MHTHNSNSNGDDDNKLSQAVWILCHALCVYEFVIRTKCIRGWWWAFSQICTTWKTAPYTNFLLFPKHTFFLYTFTPWIFLFVWIYFIFLRQGFILYPTLFPNSWQSPVLAHQVLSYIWAIVPGWTPGIWPSSSLWLEVSLPRSCCPGLGTHGPALILSSMTSSSEPPSVNLAFLEPRLWTSSLAHCRLPAGYMA